MSRARSSLETLNLEAAETYLEGLPGETPALRLAALGERIRQVDAQIRHLRAIRRFLREAWEEEWRRLEEG